MAKIAQKERGNSSGGVQSRGARGRQPVKTGTYLGKRCMGSATPFYYIHSTVCTQVPCTFSAQHLMKRWCGWVVGARALPASTGVLIQKLQWDPQQPRPLIGPALARRGEYFANLQLGYAASATSTCPGTCTSRLSVHGRRSETWRPRTRRNRDLPTSQSGRWEPPCPDIHLVS